MRLTPTVSWCRKYGRRALRGVVERNGYVGEYPASPFLHKVIWLLWHWGAEEKFVLTPGTGCLSHGCWGRHAWSDLRHAWCSFKLLSFKSEILNLDLNLNLNLNLNTSLNSRFEFEFKFKFWIWILIFKFKIWFWIGIFVFEVWFRFKFDFEFWILDSSLNFRVFNWNFDFDLESEFEF